MANTRERGVMLRLLNMEAIKAQVLPKVAATRKIWEQEPLDDIAFGCEPYAAKMDGPVVAHVVCSEGVGWSLLGEGGDPWVLPVYARFENALAIAPSYEVRMTPEDVAEFVTDEEVDLADLIRSFGARLERNFWLWHKVLTEEER